MRGTAAGCVYSFYRRGVKACWYFPNVLSPVLSMLAQGVSSHAGDPGSPAVHGVINCPQAWLVDLGGGGGCPEFIPVHSPLPLSPFLNVQVRRLQAVCKLSSRSLKAPSRQDSSQLWKGEDGSPREEERRRFLHITLSCSAQT